MWKAVLSLAFFGGLRCSEYSVPNVASAHVAPRISNVTFSDTGVMKYKVSRTKTKSHGITVTLGCSQTDICAPCTMTQYLKSRGSVSHVKADSYLFACQGNPLTSPNVNAFITDLVQSAGWDPSQYTAHSLRAGAASSAAQAGFQDWELKKLGGWESRAYISYVREQNDKVAGFAKCLAKC